MSLFFLLKRGEIVENIVMGILAHVDAGKTTLSEGMLYLSGTVRKLGRVDHKDAFLDTYSLERDRGITIFSKQAVFSLGNRRINLLDTPGHVDFSAEMERTLQVLDYAVLVISGADGVQGHTETLWKLLKLYEIPTFIFINKMDQPGTDRESLLTELKERLDEGCIVFGKGKNVESLEEIAMTDEVVLDYFMEHETVRNEDICRLIRERKIFPCYFGSALKLDGVQELLAGFEEYMKPFDGKKGFGARVFKISRDDKGERLTFLKVTGGKLVVKMPINKEEKINQIRIYSGAKYEAVNEVEAGGVCAVTGLSSSYIGQGLGVEKGTAAPFLEPVLTYQMILPEGADTTKVLRELKQLEEEEPLLNIVWNPALEEIHVQLMGEVQTEILKTMIAERFHLDVEFGTGKIVYKETIKSPVVGVGHYEPLRHYAEVHLKMEPLEAGSGLVFDTDCSEDVLDRNWQRLILTHLQEREHPGVLTGAPITDMKITIVAGRAHLKHTEGGDFRQAVYRAIRQGLMQAENVLLEPYYAFRLEIPSEMTGRALTDIQRMNGEFDGPETEDDMAVVTGSAPVSEMQDYQREVTTYSRGRGKLFCTLKGYFPCHNQDEVVEAIGYDPERDVENPTGSVFCAHGAGYNVPWQEVPEHMHIEAQLPKILEERKRLAGETEKSLDETVPVNLRKEKSGSAEAAARGGRHYARNAREDRELEEIFIRTYGRVERKADRLPKTVTAGKTPKAKKDEEGVQEYLLVDGYNVIFAWEDLKELAKENIEAARNKLMDVLCNYQGFKNYPLILVFDAYKVEGEAMEIFKYHNIHVVYTKEAETADMYIEKVVHEVGRKYHVTVVTSDGVEQVITQGQGGTIISSREFLEEVKIVNRQIQEEWELHKESAKNYLFDHMDRELAGHMEEVRMGRKELGERANDQ
jgi:small GTP-binding protein